MIMPPPSDRTPRSADRVRFVRQVLAGLPLAEAVLTLQATVLQPEFLATLFAEHRGHSYEDTLTFPVFVQLIADALQQYGGSARQALVQAQRAGTLPTGFGAFYGKLRRIPLSLSTALVCVGTQRLAELLPQQACTALPASLAAFAVYVLDGKKLKRVAKRLLPARKLAGKLFGGKLLVAWEPRTGLVLAMAANPDGEANDCRLVPDLLPQVRELRQGPRLAVADRQFCDLVQLQRFAANGDHYLVRYSKKVGFHPDPARPAQTATDAQGRAVTEEWGWLGAEDHPQRRYVRRITLLRPGEEEVAVVSDLLDAATFPAADLLSLYLIRWGIEQVFQKITKVFHLEQLIGSTPQATVFQAAFCLLLYNMIQVVQSYIAVAPSTPVPRERISTELLFRDIERQLTALTELTATEEIVAEIPAALSLSEVAARMGELLAGVWRDGWRKAINKKRRVQTAQAKKSGAHTSVHRVLEKHRQQQKAKKEELSNM
jgi:hypothetical protein